MVETVQDEEVLQPVKASRFSTEISDPPKAKKVSRTELDAEALYEGADSG